MDIFAIALSAAALVVGLSLGWFAASAKIAHWRAQVRGLLDERDRLVADVSQIRGELSSQRERFAALETHKKLLEQQTAEQQKQQATQFQQTAQGLFEEMSQKFQTQSEKKIGDLLSPLRERLGEFQKVIGDSFVQQGKEQHTLKAEIEKIVLQTNSLTKAFRGDVKAQGHWGEVMLEKILEESGLRKGVDYVAQGEQMGLEGADGNRLKPDYVIHLPEGKHIIIDAKVSLTAYDRYCGEGDDTARTLQLKEFLRSVKQHITGLERKRYQDIQALDSPEFVLMFMPLEGAYSLALQQDRELHSYAWSRKIAVVCPTTLFATLHTIAALWRRERLSQDAQEIARQGGALYDKFVGFVEDMEGIGGQIDRLQKTYDLAQNKLKSGRGNLITSVEKLKKLGAKTTKSLPEALDEDTHEMANVET